MFNKLLNVSTEWLTKVDESGNVIEREIATNTMVLSERIAYALERTLIGIIIVFGVLAVIWLVLSLFKFVFYKDPNKNAEKKQAPAAPAPKVQAPAPEIQAPVQNDDAVIAAIVAAISAMRAEQGIVDGFRVVSFKRGTNKPWNQK